MSSNTKGENRLGTNGAKFAERVKELLIHAVRGKLEDLVNSPLFKPLEPRDIRVDQNLRDITEHWNCSLTIPDDRRQG